MNLLLAATATVTPTTWPDVGLAAVVIIGACFVAWILFRD